MDRDANHEFQNIIIGLIVGGLAFLLILSMIGFVWLKPVHARDLDGKYKDNPLHAWFERLANKRGGLCCSFAEGLTVEDVDWDTKCSADNSECHYRVYFRGVTIDGTLVPDGWIDVPDEALVTEPNKYQRPVVWPYLTFNSKGTVIPAVRCFMPGVQG